MASVHGHRSRPELLQFLVSVSISFFCLTRKHCVVIIPDPTLVFGSTTGNDWVPATWSHKVDRCFKLQSATVADADWWQFRRTCQSAGIKYVKSHSHCWSYASSEFITLVCLLSTFAGSHVFYVECGLYCWLHC